MGIDPMWPNEDWRLKGGRNSWKDWLPEAEMEGIIVHKWVPCHKEPLHRSHLDKTIVLLRIGERYVPIVESAIKLVELNPIDQSSPATSERSTSQLQYHSNEGNLSLEESILKNSG